MKIITVGKIPIIYDFDIEEIYEKVCINCQTRFECIIFNYIFYIKT